jgi:hypothetical protein
MSEPELLEKMQLLTENALEECCKKKNEPRLTWLPEMLHLLTWNESSL